MMFDLWLPSLFLLQPSSTSYKLHQITCIFYKLISLSPSLDVAVSQSIQESMGVGVETSRELDRRYVVHQSPRPPPPRFFCFCVAAVTGDGGDSRRERFQMAVSLSLSVYMQEM